MTLLVDWCDAKAARHACTTWHYSKCMPVGRLAHLGVWENGSFIGAVIFGRGANRNMGHAFNLAAGEIAELCRVALREHEAPVSQVVALAIAKLRHHAPGLRLLVSYADPAQGHSGGIYQALNWIYLGTTAPVQHFRMPSGELLHHRTYTGTMFSGARRELPPGAVKELTPGKHKYVLPLDRAMRRRITKMSKPYPRGAGVQGDAPGVLPGEPSSSLGHRSNSVVVV